MAKVRREKEEELKRLALDKSVEEHIDSLYYLRMYNSAACWKGEPKVVTQELGKLKSEAAKYRAIKENIMIRTKGCGWDWAKHPWSQNGHKFSVLELAQHLHWVIQEEKKYTVPLKPVLNVPQRKQMNVLGTQTSDVNELDKKYLSDETELKKRAESLRRSRERKGEGSMHSQLQPFSQPSLNALVGLRIDVLSSVDIDSHTKCMRWFQGKVLRVVQDAHHPTVEVDWDPTPDVTGYEDGGVEEQVLLPSKWNKDNKVGSWRMDINVEEESSDDDDSDTERLVEYNDSDSDEYESISGSDVDN